MRFRATFRSLPGAVFWFVGRLLLTATALIVVAVLDVVAHTSLHVCPLRVAGVDRHAIVPVVYGRPLDGDVFAKAARGEAVLGGCVVGQVSGVCPYCRWPAAIRTADRRP